MPPVIGCDNNKQGCSVIGWAGRELAAFCRVFWCSLFLLSLSLAVSLALPSRWWSVCVVVGVDAPGSRIRLLRCTACWPASSGCLRPALCRPALCRGSDAVALSVSIYQWLVPADAIIEWWPEDRYLTPILTKSWRISHHKQLHDCCIMSMITTDMPLSYCAL